MWLKDKWTAINIHKDENFEFLTVDIKLLNSPKIDVGFVNRPPNSNAQWIEGFEERMENLSIDFNKEKLKSSSFKFKMEN